MASSGYTTLQLYHTETPGVEPAAGNLIAGELAINTADGKLFYKNTSGTVSTITSGGGSGGSGYSGYSGYSGLGLSGYSGYSGQNGASASSGYSGYSGQTGASGISGYSGSGISGFSGYSGAGGGGSVTSVNASGGVTGLSFTGGPITTSGTLTLGGTLGISGGGTNTQTTPTAGGVAFGTGTAYAFTTVGTTGQFLTSNASSNPTWASLSKSNVTDALGYTPPTPTGTGATGTWPINISGLAASASYATAAGSATTASSASTASTATYATSAGSATTASTASTAGGLTGSPNISVGTVSASGRITGSPGFGYAGSVWTHGSDGIGNINWDYSSATKIQFQSSGTIINSTGVYGTISDKRIKENVTAARSYLSDISKINVVNYNLIGNTEKMLGFVAQQVEQVLPGLVSTAPNLEYNIQDFKSIKTSVLIPMLVQAIQELKAEIDALKAAK